jgi:hypothetical protein
VRSRGNGGEKGSLREKRERGIVVRGEESRRGGVCHVPSSYWVCCVFYSPSFVNQPCLRGRKLRGRTGGEGYDSYSRDE